MQWVFYSVELEMSTQVLLFSNDLYYVMRGRLTVKIEIAH